MDAVLLGPDVLLQVTGSDSYRGVAGYTVGLEDVTAGAGVAQLCTAILVSQVEVSIQDDDAALTAPPGYLGDDRRVMECSPPMNIGVASSGSALASAKLDMLNIRVNACPSWSCP